MAAITAQTTTGQAKVDPAEIDSLTYRVGDEERTVEGPNVLAMFETYQSATTMGQLAQQFIQQSAARLESTSRLNDEMRRKAAVLWTNPNRSG